MYQKVLKLADKSKEVVGYQTSKGDIYIMPPYDFLLPYLKDTTPLILDGSPLILKTIKKKIIHV